MSVNCFLNIMHPYAVTSEPPLVRDVASVRRPLLMISVTVMSMTGLNLTFWRRDFWSILTTSKYLFQRPLGRAWRLLVFLDLRFITQDGIKQRTVNFYLPVVADETIFTKLVHEEADARPGGADHIGQCFLTKIDRDRLSYSLLAEICEEKEKPSEAPFARIEELVDQIVFDSTVARQKIG